MSNLNLSCVKHICLLKAFIDTDSQKLTGMYYNSLVFKFLTVKQDIQEFSHRNEVQRVIRFKEIKNVSVCQLEMFFHYKSIRELRVTPKHFSESCKCHREREYSVCIQ